MSEIFSPDTNESILYDKVRRYAINEVGKTRNCASNFLFYIKTTEVICTK